MKPIRIGTIINTHGLKGEVKIRSTSDFDAERYAKGKTVYIETKEGMKPFICATYRVHKGFPLVSFKDFQDINLIEQYKTCGVYADAEDRPSLKKGEYYQADLIGLKAIDEEGNELGKVIAVEPTAGAQNNLRIEQESGKTFLVPFVPVFIKKVDQKTGILTIHMEAGLL